MFLNAQKTFANKFSSNELKSRLKQKSLILNDFLGFFNVFRLTPYSIFKDENSQLSFLDFFFKYFDIASAIMNKNETIIITVAAFFSEKSIDIELTPSLSLERNNYIFSQESETLNEELGYFLENLFKSFATLKNETQLVSNFCDNLKKKIEIPQEVIANISNQIIKNYIKGKEPPTKSQIEFIKSFPEIIKLFVQNYFSLILKIQDDSNNRNMINQLEKVLLNVLPNKTNLLLDSINEITNLQDQNKIKTYLDKVKVLKIYLDK